MEEIYAFDDGRGVQVQWKPLVASRKSEYESYEDKEPPHHFRTFGAPYIHNSYKYEGGQDNIDPNAETFEGTGCYPGIVDAKVRIIHHPDDVSDLNGQILLHGSHRSWLGSLVPYMRRNTGRERFHPFPFCCCRERAGDSRCCGDSQYYKNFERWRRYHP